MSTLARIRRLSRKMEFFTTALLILIPLVLALIWAYIDASILSMANLSSSTVSPDVLTPSLRLQGFLISVVPASVMLYGLLQLRYLFQHYQQEQIFTEYALVRLRKFAWSLLLSGLLRPLSGAALSILLSQHNPPGQRVLALSISSNDVAMLFIGGVFIVIAWIMAEGIRLGDENAQIV